MGEYDHILAKKEDEQFKFLSVRIAQANEAYQANYLKRIELAILLAGKSSAERTVIEAELDQELDLTDPNSN